jgi:cytoskeletal protein RodZ
MDVSTFGVARILANAIPGSAAKRAEDAAAAAESAAELLQPPATDSDVGKALIAKTVEDGKVTEYEYGEAGGGSVTDVQVNGTSVVQDGVANVPVATDSVAGVVKLYPNGGIMTFGADTNGLICLNVASDQNMKMGIGGYNPITSGGQHTSSFYGLAKAAGADMKNITSPTVGIYPAAQKSAISTMLNAPESVSGTTPTITALAGVQYVCGEVSTLDITLPASGCVDVRFESGSTPTVLTITPPTGVTVKWAGGFDPTALEANTVYEINIADGLGVAASWT